MPDPDRKTLDLWNQYEMHPDKPRPKSFWFYFPNENKTSLAKCVLEKDGFKVEISPPDSHSDKWLCLAFKSMVPEFTELSDLRKWMENFAEELGGVYDGWETELLQ